MFVPAEVGNFSKKQEFWILDSFQFLSASLKNISKSVTVIDSQIFKKKHPKFGESSLLTQNGVYF